MAKVIMLEERRKDGKSPDPKGPATAKIVRLTTIWACAKQAA